MLFGWNSARLLPAPLIGWQLWMDDDDGWMSYRLRSKKNPQGFIDRKTHSNQETDRNPDHEPRRTTALLSATAARGTPRRAEEAATNGNPGSLQRAARTVHRPSRFKHPAESWRPASGSSDSGREQSLRPDWRKSVVSGPGPPAQSRRGDSDRVEAR